MPETTAQSGQTWNPSAYAANGRFVATMAHAVVALLNPQPNEHILDLGCGDGALTAQLAQSGAHVLGVDASPTMVAAARHLGLQIEQHTAQTLPFTSQFDAVFSNAALHWIPAPDQPQALTAVFRALKPGGRFVAEMGGQGNIASIRTALSAVLVPYAIDAEAVAASFFPSPELYRTLLEAAGFLVHSIDLHPRPTPLPGGPDGMSNWLNTFRNGVLDLLPEPARTHARTATIALLQPILHDPQSDSWTADYVRLRFHATKP